MEPSLKGVNRQQSTVNGNRPADRPAVQTTPSYLSQQGVRRTRRPPGFNRKPARGSETLLERGGGAAGGLDAGGPARRSAAPAAGVRRLRGEIHAVQRNPGRVLGGEVGEHGGEGRVEPEVVEDHLVEGVPLGVPGDRPVVPRRGAEAEGREAVAAEGEVVAAAAGGPPRASERDGRLDLRRDLPQPVLDVLGRVDQARAADPLDPSGAVVLVEDRKSVV